MNEQPTPPDIVDIAPRLNIKGGSGLPAIVPRDMNEAYRLAQAVYAAKMAPPGLDSSEKILIAILTGLELGVKPMQAIQRIAIIGNRPCIWGDLAIALVRSSGLLEWIKESIEGEGDARVAVCSAKRKGEPELIVGRFSVDDAKVAKLWTKAGPWVTHPNRMLQMRSRGFALRDGFADILGGMYLREELEGEALTVTPAIPAPPTPPPVPPIEDFESFHKALERAPNLAALNAMYAALTRSVQESDELAEAKKRYDEVAAKLSCDP